MEAEISSEQISGKNTVPIEKKAAANIELIASNGKQLGK